MYTRGMRVHRRVICPYVSLLRFVEKSVRLQTQNPSLRNQDSYIDWLCGYKSQVCKLVEFLEALRDGYLRWAPYAKQNDGKYFMGYFFLYESFLSAIPINRRLKRLMGHKNMYNT